MASAAPPMMTVAADGEIRFGPTPLDAPGRFRVAVGLLRGTDGYHVLCWLSLAVPVVLAVVGFWHLCDDPAARALAYQSLCFLLATGFTFARVYRDWAFAKLDLSGLPCGAFVGELLKPTCAYLIQCVGFFVIALGFFGYSVTYSAGVLQKASTAFYVLVVVWCTFATLQLSKCIRDRNDAALWASIDPALQAAQIETILQSACGTSGYRVLVWASAIAAGCGTLGCVATSELEIEGKGFFAVGLLFCISSAFHFAKLVRDRQDFAKSKELQFQRAFQGLVVASFVVSSICVIYGGLRLPMSGEQRLFVCSGATSTILCALSLAKDIRDRLEIQLLRASAAAKPVAATAGAPTVPAGPYGVPA